MSRCNVAQKRAHPQTAVRRRNSKVLRDWDWFLSKLSVMPDSFLSVNVHVSCGKWRLTSYTTTPTVPAKQRKAIIATIEQLADVHLGDEKLLWRPWNHKRHAE